MSINLPADMSLIYDTTLTDPQLQAFLDTASVIVTDNLSSAGLSAATLAQIEKWLAVHLACMRDPIPLRSKIGDAEAWNFPASVTTAFGQGLKLTPYGQQVLVLDYSGKLAKLGLMRATFKAAPREDSDNYSERLTKV